MAKNYWGYRIDTNHIDFFAAELKSGNLRQGWGYDSGQDLRNLSVDEGASRNLYAYNNIKKGDILLIPRCPSWNEVSIAEATDDFNNGYKFQIDSTLHDYGHIFPAKIIKTFDRNNKNVHADLRSTLKCQCRYWNINAFRNDIELLLTLSKTDLQGASSYQEKYNDVIANSFHASFDNNKFINSICTQMNDQFQASEWEFALVEGLKKLLPPPITVERTGGPEEVKHGCDIMIHYPGLLGTEYIVGIQVKDYIGKVTNYPVDQICKLDNYFKNPDIKVVDKIVLITKADKSSNAGLEQYAKQKNVRIIFEEDVKKLLYDMAKAVLGLNLN